jgi:hypothetical protein
MSALTGPPPINIDVKNDAIGGSASNELFGHGASEASFIYGFLNVALYIRLLRPDSSVNMVIPSR